MLNSNWGKLIAAILQSFLLRMVFNVKIDVGVEVRG